MKSATVARATACAFAVLLQASTVSAADAASELMAALKTCKADASVMKAADAMIKKNKGKPSDYAVDDFIDELDSDKLIDCIDDNLD